MDLAVIGSPEFTLGFQLAGISNITNPEDDDEELPSPGRNSDYDDDISESNNRLN